MNHNNKKQLESAIPKAMKNMSLTNGEPVNHSKDLQTINGHKVVNRKKVGDDFSKGTDLHEFSNQLDKTCIFDPSSVEVGRKSSIVCQTNSIQIPSRATSSSKCDSESKTQCARLDMKDAEMSEPSDKVEDEDLPKRLEMRVSTGWTGPGLATTAIYFHLYGKMQLIRSK